MWLYCICLFYLNGCKNILLILICICIRIVSMDLQLYFFFINGDSLCYNLGFSYQLLTMQHLLKHIMYTHYIICFMFLIWFTCVYLIKQKKCIPIICTCTKNMCTRYVCVFLLLLYYFILSYSRNRTVFMLKKLYNILFLLSYKSTFVSFRNRCLLYLRSFIVYLIIL